MNKLIKDHQNIQTYANEVKVIADNAIREKKTPEELQEEISNLCLNCLLPVNPECEICNGNPLINDQLILNFDVVDAEEIK